MNPSSRITAALTLTAAVCAIAAGCAGAAWFRQALPASAKPAGPMLLAPMVGVVDTCVLVPSDATHAPDSLAQRCTEPQGSAAALVESTLAQLQHPGQARGAFPLGYTLPVPLLQLFHRQGDDWEIDTQRVQRLVRTVHDTERPVILYLFSTHFATQAPIEEALARNPANLAQTRDGPLPVSTYYGDPVYPWTFSSTQTEITARRVQAAQALLDALCMLPERDLAKIRGVTLLGELHHLFPDFQAGMGFSLPYRVTDYSPASVAGFQRYLQAQFGHIGQLNRVLGSHYAAFGDVQPPSRDIRTEPLQRYTEHIDAYAHGSLPVSGWAYVPGKRTAWIHVYRNGALAGKAPVNQGRQDVLEAKPEFGDANTGWRLDLDFRRWPAGLHRIDVFLEQAPDRLTALGSRQIAIMDQRQQTPQPLPQLTLPAGVPASAGVQAAIDMPVEQSAYYYNPLVPLWHAFRGQQVADYLKFFDSVVSQSCLARVPHYTHQILPFANPSWDANKFAIDASLHSMGRIRLGVSLYGDATYGPGFPRWYGTTGHSGYGVTEFHPLKAMDAPALQQVLEQHARRGAEFLSFFLEPYWQGQAVARSHNLFSFDPGNARYGSAQLYRAMQQNLQ